MSVFMLQKTESEIHIPISFYTISEQVYCSPSLKVIVQIFLDIMNTSYSDNALKRKKEKKYLKNKESKCYAGSKFHSHRKLSSRNEIKLRK
jgi:hypothetical protein